MAIKLIFFNTNNHENKIYNYIFSLITNMY